MKRPGQYRALWVLSMLLIAAFYPAAIYSKPLFADQPMVVYLLALAVLGHVLFLPAIMLQTFIHSPRVATLKCKACEEEFSFF